MVPSAHETCPLMEPLAERADKRTKNSIQEKPFLSAHHSVRSWLHERKERTNGSISGRNASKNECAERGISRLNAFLDELKIHGFSTISNWRKRSRNVFIELNFYTAYPKMYFGTPLVKFLQW